MVVFVGIGADARPQLPALGREHHDRRVLVLAWAVLAVPAAIALGMSLDVLVFVVQGLVLVGAAVVLTAQHQQCDRARDRPRREAFALASGSGSRTRWRAASARR